MCGDYLTTGTQTSEENLLRQMLGELSIAISPRLSYIYISITRWLQIRWRRVVAKVVAMTEEIRRHGSFAVANVSHFQMESWQNGSSTRPAEELRDSLRATLILFDSWRAGRTAIAPVLKTGGRKPLGVRIPRSPQDYALRSGASSCRPVRRSSLCERSRTRVRP